ncbi:MAG: GTPase HflX [Alphaproteobacteria bacterium]|nr:GTPase HflX [Alphaproteobacteria bacterium]
MSDKTFVLHPVLKNGTNSERSADAGLEEIKNLTAAIDLEVVAAEVVYLNKINVSLYVGKGVVERIHDIVQQENITLMVINTQLSPIQQRNLERMLNVKVIDRTALTLEIFGERARTKEGVLQVELAHLTYQRSRLVRGWTHLERQRGGRGFLGGPGETQIELDKRVITDNIVKLKNQLEEVRRTRQLHRSARQRVPFPVVAFVGYTNAGKSTLFNKLTNSDVFAKNMLFATLDPTMRQLKLPSGKIVILSDTVGFISNLPTELVAAFRATLEEVLEADLVVHVRDISHPDTLAQKSDVEEVLKGLGLKEKVDKGLLEVLNKVDLIDKDEQKALIESGKRNHNRIAVSAITGLGIEELLSVIDAELSKKDKKYKIIIKASEGKCLSDIYKNANVLLRLDDDDKIILTIKIEEVSLKKIVKLYPQVKYVEIS